ncbi:DUF3329 domain-containing protein [Mesorhizobium sp. NZP2298]|jgi:hypothetical protein|uniref:DUF3329 domain-containing protein n=1 Tax=Mesorhizobium sp. NZP2298 TaxID=2483403 RepID=UPI001557C85C|nr:DUF3329 domain-containing protein [Mesorhizobium sp. NZP2298]QKC93704.1 DUF3329 domain-containing protein [Mesorhizobium sp. NZP2298]
MKDSEHPFFRPLWRRVAVVAVCVIWSIIEFATGTPFWGVLALGFAGYGVWQFFYLYKPAEENKATAEPEPKE